MVSVSLVGYRASPLMTTLGSGPVSITESECSIVLLLLVYLPPATCQNPVSDVVFTVLWAACIYKLYWTFDTGLSISCAMDLGCLMMM